MSLDPIAWERTDLSRTVVGEAHISLGAIKPNSLGTSVIPREFRGESKPPI